MAERVADEPRPPQEALNDWQPTPAPPAEPVEDPDKQRWIEELALTPEGRRDAVLVRETHETTIENYRGGSPAEMGGYVPVQRQSNCKPTAAELYRRLSRRSELL